MVKWLGLFFTLAMAYLVFLSPAIILWIYNIQKLTIAFNGM